MAVWSWGGVGGGDFPSPLMAILSGAMYNKETPFGLTKLVLTLVLLNSDIPCFANSVDPYQLAFSEAN